MWEFTGEAFEDDDVFEDGGSGAQAEPEPEVYDPGMSNRSIMLIALGLLAVVAAASFVAYLMLQKQPSSSEPADAEAEKVATESPETPEREDDPAEQAESRADADAKAASEAIVSRAKVVSSAANASEPKIEEEDESPEARTETSASTASSSDTPRSKPPTREQPKASKSLWVRVESSPAGAIVTTDGKLVGMTPCKVKFESEEQTQRVKFDKDGYEPIFVQLNRDDYPSRSVSLTQKAADSTSDGEASSADEEGSAPDESGLRLAP